MSWDVAVWHTERELTDEEAAELYVALCDEDTSGVTPSPRVDAFYAELTALHPELDDIPEERIDDHDFCPWSVAHDRSPGHVAMSCVWSKADYVLDLVLRLAKKHELAVYDPQSEMVIYPDDNIGGLLSEPEPEGTSDDNAGLPSAQRASRLERFWDRLRRVIWSGR